MAETKCGFCKGTKFELVPTPIEGIDYAHIYQCAGCGHPVGIIYESETQGRMLNRIARDVKELKH